MRTKQFWLDALERALSTLAQTLLAWMAVDIALWDLDWQQGLGVALTAAVASVLKSIAASNVAEPETASLVHVGRHRAGE